MNIEDVALSNLPFIVWNSFSKIWSQHYYQLYVEPFNVYLLKVIKNVCLDFSLKEFTWQIIRSHSAGGSSAIVFAPWPLINQAYQGCSQIQSLRVATRWNEWTLTEQIELFQTTTASWSTNFNAIDLFA